MFNKYKELKKFLELILNISNKFIGISDLNKSINSALEDIGKFKKASRIYIFLFNEDRNYVNNCYEWCNDDIESQINIFKIIKTSSISWVISQITKHEKLKINNIKKLPTEAYQDSLLLKKNKVKSTLIFPIKNNNTTIGFIGFDYENKQKRWNIIDLYLLGKLRDILGSALDKEDKFKSLENKNTYYEKLFKNSINPIILTDIEGGFIDFNKAALDFLEVKEKDIVGKKIWDFYPDSLMNSQKINFIENSINTYMEKKFCINGELKTLIFNKFPITINGKKHHFNIGQDITHLKKLEYKLEQNEQFYKSLYDYNVDFVFSLDLQGNIIMVNTRVKEMTGYTAEELIGRYFTEFVPQEELEKVVREFSDTIKGNSRMFESIAFHKKGQKVILDIQTVPIIIDEKVTGVYIIARDITEMKETGRTLRKLLKENERLLKETIENDEIKTEFFCNLSHEFKTPINLILGVAQLLEKYNFEEVKKLNPQHIKIIKQNSYRLLKLVNNLVDISRVDANYMQFNPRSYDIVNVVENIVLSVADFAKSNGLDIIFDTQVEEIVMDCDVDKIERILLNLISNSIKFTDPCGSIFIDIEKDLDNLILKVKDTGIGISKDKINIIFDRFRQVDALLNRRSEGSGIGLSLVKSFVEMHEGKITVDSEVGVGTTFFIKIPIKNDKITIEDNSYHSEDNNLVEKMNIEFSDIYY
ncbi:PAS domain S-box protein [Clostridium sp. D2Q-11]|uniref:histidine kinase n=1 Tax=Anaeromonas frigoriresistens TaxID=2683708 RepID=A0A942V2T8_9FIRM|nr:PAS domain S-box protein [Anaeromonas frigoriresistens]MBS4538937.1 PAS domain S-box protein [Anaeromonas frigoriresistens]